MIELEHTLIILLLLVSLLNARPRLPAVVRWIAWAGVALALVAPTAPIPLPWDWLAGLTIPILVWHIARNLVQARWFEKLGDLLAWLGIALAIAVLHTLTAGLQAAAGIVFGILVASMVWRGLEDEARPSYLGQLGPLALAFLLAEIAPTVEAPGRYFLALIAGSAIGALSGYLTVQLATRVKAGRLRDLLAVGQAYLAYGIAVWLDLSGVAAAFLSVAVFVTYGIQRGLWPEGNVRPRPLASPIIFIPAVAGLAFFGWQTHVPLTLPLLVEIFVGLLLVGIIVWVSRSMSITEFLRERTYPLALLRASLLLAAALLLWPRDVLLDPAPLALALATASLAIFGTHHSLAPIIHFYSWLDEREWEPEPDSQGALPRAESVMMRDVSFARPDTPLPDLARLLLETRQECLPVIDDGDRMVGLVTEADLFIKEERLPWSEETYPTLFGSPVKPEELYTMYVRLGETRRASDVMSRQIVWVKPAHTVGQAFRLMSRFGYKCLPVITADPGEGGKLVGLVSRSALIGLLVDESGQASKGQGSVPARNHPSV